MTRKAAFIIFVPLVIVLVALDRITKIWASAALSGNASGGGAAASSSNLAAQSTSAAQSFNFPFIDFTLVHNTGAAFGIGSQSTWLFIIIASVIVIGIIFWLCISKNLKPGLVIALSLLAAGGIGNVVDRVIFGYVVDFIEFNFIEFPVFNVADICVTVGVILLFIQVLFFGGVSAGSEPASDELNGAGDESADSEPAGDELNGAGGESAASELNGAGNEPAANESVAGVLNGAGNEPAASEFASKVAADIVLSDANKGAGERGVRQESELQAGALQKDESQQSGCGVRQENQEKLATQEGAGDKSAARGHRN